MTKQSSQPINGRDVTIAVLGEKMDNMHAEVRDLHTEVRDLLAEVRGNAHQINVNKVAIAEHGQRLSFVAATQGTLSFVFAAIAAWIGSRQ